MNTSPSIERKLVQLFGELEIALSQITFRRSPTGKVYFEIIKEILKLIPQSPNPQVCVFLIGQLHTASHEITRSTAAEALGKLKDVTAVDSLLQVLGNANEYKEVRSEAAVALGEIGATAAVPSLIENLRNKRNGRTVMWHCADALGSFNNPPVVDALIDALIDDYSGIRDSSDIRDAASDALGVIGSDYAVSRLLDLLNRESLDPKDYMDISLRQDVIMTLGKSKNPLCINPLLKILHDPQSNAELQASTVVAISNYADPRVVPALEVALNSADESTRIQAKIALDKIKGK